MSEGEPPELRVVADNPPPRPKEGARLLRWHRFKTRTASRARALGAADIGLPNGLEIKGVIVYERRAGQGSPARRWANLPVSPRIGAKAGILELVRDAGGRPVYDSLVVWGSRALAEGFSRRVVELVEAAHPADLPPLPPL